MLLPSDIFTDMDGTRTLALVRDAVGEPGGLLRPRAAHRRPDADRPTDATTRREEVIHAPPSHGPSGSAPPTASTRAPPRCSRRRRRTAGIPVTIAKDSGAPVNAASILGVIALGVEQGDYVTLTADGDGAGPVLDTLAELLTTDHDAE